MPSNRRYGAPDDREAGRALSALAFLPSEPRTRLVWVRMNDRPDSGAYPGLVVSWRREVARDDLPRWAAHVAYVPAGDQLTVAWVPAARLLPVRPP